MQEIKCILFDCMETVVDVIEKPDMRMYASWAYHGCGYEGLWDSFDSFSDEYSNARKTIESSNKEYQEQNIIDRFMLMVRGKLNDKVEEVAETILKNYWTNYKANCYVDKNVKNTISKIHREYKCGVVSNFMVHGGIEELLEFHEIDKYFDFVVTSVKTGWRKPYKAIFEEAFNLIGVSKEQILFVGDDYICDYVGATQYGIKAILLDKNNANKEAKNKIQSIDSLLQILPSYAKGIQL